MKSILLVVLAVSTCLAEKKESALPRPARASQGHIQYSDPDGLKVSWKLYSPHSQWRSHLEDTQRNARAESGTAQPSFRPYQGELIRPATSNVATAAPSDAAPEKSLQTVHQVQVQYKPYSMVPSHIKQLMLEMYEPQGPYIDPAVFIYRAHRQLEEEKQRQQASTEEEESTAQATSLSQHDDSPTQFEHIPKFETKFSYNKPKVDLAQYADDQPTYATTANPQYGTVPQRQESSIEESSDEQQQRQPQTQAQEDNMPKEIHELLNLQAQIPYHVIADRIVYKPKSMFIPKPFKEDAKSPYKYRTKIYYIKNDESEEQKNKERKERDEPKESAEEEQQQPEE